jgi:branched-chain amino acid transport system ATP-binding protein
MSDGNGALAAARTAAIGEQGDVEGAAAAAAAAGAGAAAAGAGAAAAGAGAAAAAAAATPTAVAGPARRPIGDVILAAENISLAFGGVKALTDVSFDIRQHEIRAIIGPNGAGKSSMLNVINGVYAPQHGRIVFHGQPFSRMSPHRVARAGVARTFQSLALFKGMSVLDNIMTGRSLRMKRGLLAQMLRVGPALTEELVHREFVERIIEFLEIQNYRKTPVGRLPYGLQKRVDLGRALAMEPTLLLLDEPMAGMNVEEKQDMSRFVLDVNDEFGTTIVLIEHDMGVVMDISDRVVVLDYGRKIGDGLPDEVRRNEEVIRAYLGTAH